MMVTFSLSRIYQITLNCPQEARFFLLFITVTTNRQKYTQLVSPIDPTTIQITPFSYTPTKTHFLCQYILY